MFALTVNFVYAQLLHQGHAHNDYLKSPPLYAALENGITSIEVDVYDVKGKIRVAHIPLFLNGKPLLKTLYLEPLSKRINENGGTVFQNDSTQLILIIELKRNHKVLLDLLHSELEMYPGLFDVSRGKFKRWGPIKIILTGGVSANLISSDEFALFSLDGGLNALNNKADSNLIHRISMNYASYFNWKGKGPMPEAERAWLIEKVSQANAMGYELRFWNMPNKEAIWEVFLRLGVHRINVDDYAKFAHFIRNKNW